MSEIKLVEIDVDGVGEPRNDGTPGSALYSVPIRLSQTPSRTWSEIFVSVWDHPPSYTTMHRPGIASVAGDRVILDGTTVEEVRDVHTKTLKLVVAEANRRAVEHEEQEAAERDMKTKEAESHRRNVHDVAEGIDFD